MNGFSEFLFGGMSLALMVSGCISVDGSNPQCRSSGGFRAAELTAAEACDQFMARLSDTLGAAARGDIAAGYEFDLAVTGKGTITSVVSQSDAPRFSGYPPVSVDAMDRALNRGDLERLADAVAALLLEHHGEDRAKP